MINAKRMFYILLGLCILITALVISTAVLGNQVSQKQYDRLSELKAKNQALEEQTIGLVKAKKDIEKYSELNDIAKTVVPQDKDQARTIREINKIADESGITLSQISFETSTLGEGQKPSSASSTSKTKLTQVAPVEGIPGVYSLEIDVQSSQSNPVSYSRFLTFLEKLESNRRTAHVSQISVAPQQGGQSVTFSLVLKAYVKP